MSQTENLNITNLVTQNLDTWTSAIQQKSASGRGSSKKRELYGIKKLRELILELAVRGKLVPQAPNDEPASVLLERIAAEKAELVKQKKIKKPKTLPEIAEDEKPFELPEGWEWVRLGNLVEVLDSMRKPISKKDRVEGPYPYYGASGIVDYVAEYIFDEDLVLIGEDGAKWGSGDYTGFCVSGKTWVNNHAHVVRCYEKGLVDAFLVNALAQQDLKSYITGITVPKLNQAKLVTIVLPIPSIAEQHRIVAKVDELMALCDQLEQQTETSLYAHATLVDVLLKTLTDSRDAKELATNWARLSDHFDTLFTTEASIDALKQTILQLAVMGKLVPQDSNDEPAAKLLERIAAEKDDLVKQKKIKKQKPLPPISEDEKPFPLPQGWEWAPLGSLTAPEDNAMCDGPFGSKLKTEHYIDNKGFAVVRLGNIGIGEFLWGKEGYIRADHFALLESNHLKSGDLLIAGMAEPIIRACEVPDALGPSVNKADCFRLRTHEFLDTKYICLYLNSPISKQFAGQENRGMTRLRINLSKCKAIPIPMPPIKEQRYITAKVDQLMALCDQLKQRLHQVQQTQLHLADALVEQALEEKALSSTHHQPNHGGK